MTTRTRLSSSLLALLFLIAFLIACGGGGGPGSARSPGPTSKAAASVATGAGDSKSAVVIEPPPIGAPVEIALQVPHGVPVAHVALSGDGRVLVTTANDATKIWDLRSNLQLRSMRTAIGGVVLDETGRHMVGTAERGKQLHIVDVATMKRHTIDSADGFSSHQLTADGTRVVAGNGHFVRVYSVEDGREVSSWRVVPEKDTTGEPNRAGVSGVALDATGKSVAVIANGDIQIFDLATHAAKCKVAPQRDGVMVMFVQTLSVVFDSTGTLLATTRNDGFTSVWDLTACKQRDTFLAPQFKRENGESPAEMYELLGFLPNNTGVLGIVSKSEDDGPSSGGFRRFDFTSKKIEPFAAKIVDPLRVKGALSRDARLVAVAGWSNVSVVDVARQETTRVIQATADSGLPLGIDENTDELFVAAPIQKTDRVDVIDLRHASKVRSFALPKGPTAFAMDLRAGRLAIAHDVTPAAQAKSYSARKTAISMLDKFGRIVNTLATLNGSVHTMTFNDDGTTLAVASYEGEHHLHAYDLKSNTQLWDQKKKAHGFDSDVKRIRMRGKYIITGRGSNATIHDAATGRELVAKLIAGGDAGQRTHRDIVNVDLSPDGTHAITSGDAGEIRIWSLPSGKLERKWGDGRGETHQKVFAFFPGAKKEMLVVDGLGVARLVDPTTATEVASSSYSAHDGDVYFGVASATARWTATVGADLAIRITRNEAGGKGSAILIGNPSGDWAFVSQQNKYLAPRGSLSSLAFRVGARAYPFDQFDALYNRPEVVLTELGAGAASIQRAHALTERRLRRLGIGETADANASVPSVAVLTTNVPAKTTQRTLPLKVQASDAASDIDRIEVFVNEVPAATVSTRARKSKGVEASIDVALGVGSNRIQVSAFNARGLESLRETVSVILEAAPNAPKPQLHLFVIGISKYKDSRFDLDYAAKDARDVAAFFRANGGKRFSKVNVTQVVDLEATKDRMMGLRAAMEATKVDDELVVFLAGHGLLDPKSLEYYFATTDIDPKSPSTTGLPFAALDELLRHAPARKKLLFMDTCHSGEAEPDDPTSKLEPGVRSRALRLETTHVGASAAAPATAAAVVAAPAAALRESVTFLSEEFADLRRSSGATVLASASGRELAFESGARKNGLFTAAVLEGLEGARADRDHDGEVRVSELRQFVADRVVASSGGRQHPTARRENVILDFPVY